MFEINQNLVISAVIFAIILFVAAIFIISSRREKEKSIPKPSHNRPNVLKKDKNQEILKRKKFAVLILGVFVLMSTIAYTIFKNGDGNSSDSFSMMPIWVAVFLPLLARKKKQKQETKNASIEQRKILFFVMLAMFSFFIGILFLVFIN